MIQHIYILLLVLLSLTSFITCNTNELSNQQDTDTTQYNVLFIAIDDLRPELNCYGKSHIISPNIDTLAREGLVFNRAYCQYAVCNPSRTSLLTGLRPDKTRVYRNRTNFRTKSPDLITLPQYFKIHGYITASIGKIYHKQALNDKLSWSTPSWHGRRKGKGISSSRGYMLKNNMKNKNGIGAAIEITDFPEQNYRDGQFAVKAIRTLRELKDTTFFLAVGFEKPHLPFAMPQKYWDLYENTEIKIPTINKPPKGSFKYAFKNWLELKHYTDISKDGIPDSQGVQLIRAYYACTSFVDAQIGKIMKEVKNLGLDKNTIVVLWGDHGWKLGDYGQWTKQSNFEVDTRSPLIITTPNMKAKNKKTNTIVEFIDIYPTLCELTDLPIPENIDGSSFANLLNDPNQKGKGYAMSQQIRANYMSHTLRTDNYRFIRWVNEKLKRKHYELYDLKKDPQETINVAQDSTYSDILRDLEQQLINANNEK